MSVCVCENEECNPQKMRLEEAVISGSEVWISQSPAPSESPSDISSGHTCAVILSHVKCISTDNSVVT